MAQLEPYLATFLNVLKVATFLNVSPLLCRNVFKRTVTQNHAVNFNCAICKLRHIL